MPFLVGLAALAVFVWITPPVSGLGDGPEFTVGLATAGLVHPPGYPLYVLSGHLFVRSLHFLGAPWPWAANAWSALGAAFAVALCFVAARRLVAFEAKTAAVSPSRGWSAVAALLPAAFLACNPVLLQEAAEAEVNSWSLAWTLGISLAFLGGVQSAARGVDDRFRRAGAPPVRARDGVLWGALCGVGLAHHPSSVWVSAPLTLMLAAILVRGRLVRPRLAAGALAGAAIPLLAYLFVAWRAAHPAPGQWPIIEPTAASVLEHVSGRRYQPFFGHFAPDGASRSLLASGVYPFLLPSLLLLGIAGARAWSAAGRVLYGGLLAAAILTLLFAQNYGVPDPAPYFLPAIGIALLGIAPCAWALAATRAGRAAVAATALLVAAAAWSGLHEARVRREDALRFEQEVRTLWAHVPETEAFLFWNADQVARLIEYQTLRDERPRVWVGNPEWLLDPPVRARVRRRFGADPLDGLRIPYTPVSAPWGAAVRREFIGVVLERLGARTGMPVYWFDPTIPRLALVRNPAAFGVRRESGSP